jgi:hypothetical protein
MSSAKLKKISETIEMVEIFFWLWFRDPQLIRLSRSKQLWVNSIHIMAFPAAAGLTVG